MCRLYAFHSNEDTKVECTLVHAQNALLLQSRSDLTGREHSDGWGIGYFIDEKPFVEKQAAAAFRDLSFSRTAESVFSKTVVAHVRLATVGTPQIENAHPFRFGNWLFAHNGTLQGFSELQPGLAAETRPKLQSLRRGSTDSEQFFLWLMSRLLDAGCVTPEGCCNPDATARELGELIVEIDQRSRAAADRNQIEKTPRLNIVLTDGATLFATRWNNSLFFAQRDNITDCEICGVPHVHHQPGTHFRSVVLASEPISEEVWQEVPNQTLLCVTQDLQVTRHCLRSPQYLSPL